MQALSWELMQPSQSSARNQPDYPYHRRTSTISCARRARQLCVQRIHLVRSAGAVFSKSQFGTSFVQKSKVAAYLRCRTHFISRCWLITQSTTYRMSWLVAPRTRVCLDELTALVFILKTNSPSLRQLGAWLHPGAPLEIPGETTTPGFTDFFVVLSPL